MNSTVRRIACWSAIVMLAAGCRTTTGPTNTTSDTPYEIERYRQAFLFSSDGAAVISNPLGDLRIRSAKGGEPLLSAVIQRLHGESRPVDFRIDSDGGTATLAVLAAGNFDGRVDTVVLIPDGTHIDAEVTFGLLEIRVKSRSARARSDSGEIRVRTSGNVDAQTRQGNISLSLQDAAEWSAPTTLRSREGSVTIYTPVGADLVLDLAAREIDNQMPETVDAHFEVSGTRLRGQINTGTLDLRASAPNGVVKLIGF